MSCVLVIYFQSGSLQFELVLAFMGLLFPLKTLEQLLPALLFHIRQDMNF